MVALDATHQSLIKACSKDTFYINILRNHLNGISQQVFGDRLWILWRKEIELIADLLYFMLTTVQGSQTLGEEYTCVVQVDLSKRKIPTQLQRSFQVLLQCCSPYFIDKLITQLQHKVNHISGLSPKQRKLSVSLITLLHKCLPLIQQMHLVLFYVQGAYLHISKRIASVKHVLIRPMTKGETDDETFRWLAILGGIQVLGKLITLFKEMRMDASTEDSHVPVPLKKNEHSNAKCVLCLERIRNISSTVCGHLFCWKCIVEWCAVKSECPTCRESCSPSKVVRLHHFDV